jgi:hypothetical protein
VLNFRTTGEAALDPGTGELSRKGVAPPLDSLPRFEAEVEGTRSAPRPEPGEAGAREAPGGCGGSARRMRDLLSTAPRDFLAANVRAWREKQSISELAYQKCHHRLVASLLS